MTTQLPDLLSASAINSFNKCPQQYYLNRLERQGLIHGIQTDQRALMFGSVWHNQIIDEYFSMIPDTPTPVDIERCARDAYGIYKYEPNEDFEEKGVKCLENFIKFEIERTKWPQPFKPTLREKEFKTNYFNGRIDMVVGDIVIDWKTTKATTVSEDYIIQGNIYRKICEANGIPILKVLFVMLENGKVLETPKATDGYLEAQIEKILNAYKTGKYPENIGWWCMYCSYVMRCHANLKKITFENYHDIFTV